MPARQEEQEERIFMEAQGRQSVNMGRGERVLGSHGSGRMELIGDLAKSQFILLWEERMEGEATRVTVNVDERSVTG